MCARARARARVCVCVFSCFVVVVFLFIVSLKSEIGKTLLPEADSLLKQ